MAKIYERLLSTNIPQEEKRRDSFDPRSLNLLGEDSTSILMVNRLEILRMIDCFFFVFFCFVLIHD